MTKARLPLMIFFVCVALEWPIAAISHIIGFYDENDLLTNNTVGDSLTLVLAIGAAVLQLATAGQGAIRRMASVIFLVTILIVMQVVIGFSGSVSFDSWNTPLAELVRSAAIFFMYILFIASPNQLPYLPRPNLAAYSYIFLAFALLSLFIAILQSRQMLPNFYFQWFNGQELPRPAGGLSHPHYFAFLNGLGMPLAALLRRRGGVSRPIALLMALALLGAIVVSTSRVGMITGLLSFLLVTKDIYDLKMGKYVAYGIGIAILAVLVGTILEIAGFEFVSVQQSAEVFFSFIKSDNTDLFRGREANWGVEISLILASPFRLILGYGYQPYVSHNLILRQLQVSGIVGTILYLWLLFKVHKRALGAMAPDLKQIYWVVPLQTIVASLTFPILISLAVNAAALFVLTTLVIASADAGPVRVSQRETRRSFGSRGGTMAYQRRVA